MIERVLVAQQDVERITVFRVEPGSGHLDVELQYALPGGPAPMAVDPLGRWVIVGLRNRPGLATVRLDPAQVLSPVGAIALPRDPCYVSIDRSGRYALTAYYASGGCAVHRIMDDGTLEPEAVQWVGSEPHAHCIHTDPGNQYAYLPQTMPADRILQFAFDAATGRLSPLTEPLAPVQGGHGPRHYDYHPSKNWVYFSNEDGSSVSAYALAPETGFLSLLGTWSTLPKGFGGRNTCAQIHIHPSGRWLYVSNRGHDSLAIFAIDAETGLLTPAGHQPTEPTPRAFNIDPAGRMLYVAGLGSDRLATYWVDEETGQLEGLDTYPLGRNPMWVLPLSTPEPA